MVEESRELHKQVERWLVQSGWGDHPHLVPRAVLGPYGVEVYGVPRASTQSGRMEELRHIAKGILMPSMCPKCRGEAEEKFPAPAQQFREALQEKFRLMVDTVDIDGFDLEALILGWKEGVTR